MLDYEYIKNNLQTPAIDYKDLLLNLYGGEDLYKEPQLEPSKFLSQDGSNLNYLNVNFVKQSLDVLVDLIGFEQMQIDFKNTVLNLQFKELSENKQLDVVFQQATILMLLLGYCFVQTDKDGAYLLTPDKVKIFLDPENILKNTNIYSTGNASLSYIFTDDETIKVQNNSIEIVPNELPNTPVQLFNNSFTTFERLTGKSIFNESVLSKIKFYNHLLHLAFKLQRTNMSPKMSVSQATGNLLRQAIKKAKTWYNQISGLDDAISADDIEQQLKSSKNIAIQDSLLDDMSLQILNKKLTFFVNDGNGEDKFITNPQSAEDCYRLMEILENKIMHDLAVSKAIFERTASGADPSSKALKLQMMNTVAKVNSIKKLIKKPIANIAQNILALEYPKFKDIPKPNVIFADIYSGVLAVDDEENLATVDRIIERINQPE